MLYTDNKMILQKQNTNKLYMLLLLKDSFVIGRRLHTGLYDANYRKLIKKSLLNISNKTSFPTKLDSSFEIMNLPECSHLRVGISIPDGWSEDSFLNIAIKEIERNPSVDMILENFTSTSAELERDFFSYHWKGFRSQGDKG